MRDQPLSLVEVFREALPRSEAIRSRQSVRPSLSVSHFSLAEVFREVLLRSEVIRSPHFELENTAPERTRHFRWSLERSNRQAKTKKSKLKSKTSFFIAIRTTVRNLHKPIPPPMSRR